MEILFYELIKILIKKSEWEYIPWTNNVPPRSHGLLNKSPEARCEMPPYKLLEGKVSKAPKAHRLLPLLLASHQN